MKKWALLVVGCALFSSLPSCKPKLPTTPESEPSIPEATSLEAPGDAAAFERIDAVKEPWTLDALKGKVALVDFWASFVPPSAGEGADLADLAERYRGREFALVGFCVEQGTLAELEHKVQTCRPGDYPQLRANDAVYARFGDIRPIPTKLLLDANGEIKSTFLGVVPLEAIAREIDSLLGADR